VNSTSSKADDAKADEVRALLEAELSDVRRCISLVKRWGARNEDEIGEMLLAVYYALGHIKAGFSRAQAMSYLYKSARNALWKMRVGISKRQSVEEPYKYQLSDTSDVGSDEDMYDAVEVDCILSSLRNDIANVIRLLMSGMTWAEISEQLGVSRGYIHRVSIKMQESMCNDKCKWS